MIGGFLKLFQKKSLSWTEVLFWKKVLKPVFKFLIGWMPPYKD